MDNLTEIFTRLETPFQIDLSELDKSVSKLDIGHYTEAQLDLADSWMKAMKNSTTELLVKTPGFDKVLLLDTLCEMYRRRHPDSSSSDSKIAEFIRLHPYRTQQDSVRVKGWGKVYREDACMPRDQTCSLLHIRTTLEICTDTILIVVKKSLAR